jgi:glycosyltransferase involved in cell wall biosynthesis
MKIGIFHPALNTCGGGEWVTLNIINSLRKNGHKVIVLTDERIDQTKFIKTFGENLKTDGEIILPFHLFGRGNPHNIYSDVICCLILKSKCHIVIDTFTDWVLPGIDVIYMQNVPPPPTKRYKGLKNSIYFIPYQIYERRIQKNNTKIIFSNSKFTSETLKNHLGLDSYLLYPPLSSFYLQQEESNYSPKRLNQVVTISRFAPEKRLEMVLHIAKQLDEVKFLIIGNLSYRKVYLQLLKLIKDLKLEEKVVLMANVPREQLREILLNSKICLHCSNNEAFGISLIEAMACGCLPIAYDAGGPKEIVPEKFRFTAVDEAAQKIKEMIKDWTPRNAWEMRNSTLKFSEQVFSKQLLSILGSHRLLGKENKE